MSVLVWPTTIPGLKISMTRTPVHDTKIVTTQSGREMRSTWSTYPRYRYTLDFELLRSGTQVEFQKIFGFFVRHFGAFDSFLFTDDEDSVATVEEFGVGNASLTAFQLQRTLVANADLAAPASRTYWPGIGDGYEPVFELNGAPSIFVSAVLQTANTDYTVGLTTGIVQFLVRTPGVPALTPSTTGGTLATGTVFVKLTALGTTGETLAAAEQSAPVTGPNASVGVTWGAVTGAVSYRVYVGSTTNTEGQFFATAGTSLTVTTLTGTAGTPPGAATATRAPAAAAVLTWTGAYYRRVRFEVDSMQAGRIVQTFWEARSIGLISVKP